jgi:ABC-2 type transport system ATP-binding protein
VISVEAVTKRYGEQRGIEDVSFTVEAGEILGFLGPNGAGKTTTLRILTGYLPPAAGTVRVGGHELWAEPMAVRRQIGYLPENPPLYPDMSVRDYLGFIADLRGVGRRKRTAAVERAAERTDTADVLGRLIGHLSKGYRQRIGLAQALVGEPPVLILDEPTIGLDPRQILDVRELIRGLAGEHTVLFSSHILPEVSQVSDRVVIINEGRTVAQGSPAELSRRLGGGQRVHARVGAPGETVRSTLAGVPGVAHYEVRDAGDGTAELDLEAEADTDPRADLFYRLAEAHAPLLELNPRDLSLEDVFLHLTTRDAVPEEAARA